MRIRRLVWPEDRVAHLARHGVRPVEVEEACFGRPLTLRAKSQGPNPVYYVLGQTAAGRYVFCVVIRLPNETGLPVTARSMTPRERQRFIRWRDR